jgi:serine protease Do
VVGINTAIVASGQGIGFAIPINMAKGIIAQLKNNGEVTRGWLGVAIQPLSRELSDYYDIKDGKGVLVTHVFKGDPADQAGIRPRDIILSVNDKKIADSRDLTRTIANLGVGETAIITVFRDGEIRRFKVKIARREDEKLAHRQPKKPADDELGIRVAEVSPEMTRRFNLATKGGVIVVGTDPESEAAKAGLQVGDLIKEINHQKINSVKDYRRVIAKIETGETVSLFIRRMKAGFQVIKFTKNVDKYPAPQGPALE